MTPADAQFLANWNAWANRRLAQVLATHANPPILRLLAVMLGEASLWLDRVEGVSEITPFPENNAKALLVALEDQSARFCAVAQTLKGQDFGRDVIYSNPAGLPQHAALNAVLVHVAGLQAEQRGRIGLLLEAGGATVPSLTALQYTTDSSIA